MILSAEDTTMAAKALCEATTPEMKWEEVPKHTKRAFELIVTDLAEKLKCKNTPEAVAVFMAWMGDDKSLQDLKKVLAMCEPLTPLKEVKND
jgi:hypothetical protein